MSISSSLNAGVTGLRANASRLAAISDNIANSSTFGYKRVTTDFHSMVISSSRSTYDAGGVRSTNQRLIDERGTLVSTTNATDLAVRGRGMLPVTSVSNVVAGEVNPRMMLTTTGSFRLDQNGYLVSQSGLALMGWPANGDGSIPGFSRDTPAGLEPIRVGVNQLSGEPTTRIAMSLNLPATATQVGAAGQSQVLSVEYHDNLGTSESLDITFTPTVPDAGVSNEWMMVIRDSASGGAVVGEYRLTFDDDRATGGTLAAVATESGGEYDPATGSIVVTVDGGPIELSIGLPGQRGGLSQLSDTFAPISITKDGSAVGNMTRIDIDANGFVYANFDTGVTRRVYQIPLVDLPNPNGMRVLDNQTYLPSSASGTYFLWDAGSGPTGEIAPFALEESTTDIANELTGMIQTQRAYSSNAKVIQTVDEMLQETTNIKR